jgi:AcrR family transcriptional regulator
MTQGIDIVRRTPSQARATATVDTFFEATAQILESGDLSTLTTNHIAERAGFSIGTLYSYFPNKQSLLRAMALREAQQQQLRVLRALEEAGLDRSVEDLVRIVMRATLRPFEGRNRMRLTMMKLFAKDSDLIAAANTMQEQVISVLLREIEMRSNGAMATLGPETRFMLHAAVSGAIQAAATERTDIFDTQTFEDDIVRLVTSYMQ